MRIAVALLLVGCLGQGHDPSLRIEPAELDVDVELGVPRRVPFQVFYGDIDVTDEATYTIDGAPLGSVDAAGFSASASIAGRARIVVKHDSGAVTAPVRVKLKSRRYVGAPVDAPEWFRAGTESTVDLALEPGDGAVLPPNLGRLDVHFAADDFEDVHETAFTSDHLDIRIYTVGLPGARTTEVTPTEWYAIAQSNRGDIVELAVRSTRIIARDNIRKARATLRIADLDIAREIMFTGRSGVEMPQMWTYEVAHAKTTAWHPAKPAGSCVGCHVAISKDGHRIAAGGNDGTVGGGAIYDTATRQLTAPYNPANNWIAAAFDPSGSLLTTTQGILTWRDGLTATPIKVLKTDIDASQPAVSNNGRFVAYVGGPMDDVTKNPIPQEMRIHEWSAALGELSNGRVLVEPTAGETLKLPEFSPDDEWVLYSRVRAGAVSIFARPADGRFLPSELIANADFARFASPVAVVHAGSAATEKMAWVVMKRYTAVGVRNQDKVGQLWAAAFFPERGVLSRPIYLSGQRADIAVLHAPLAVH